MYLQMLVSLCEHGTVIIDHHKYLFAKQWNFMKILSSYCYNDADNEFMTTKNNELKFSFHYKNYNNHLHSQENTYEGLLDEQSTLL